MESETFIEPIAFEEFPKMARLSRECVITEKIDGTNAQIFIADDMSTMMVGSRNKWLTEKSDNFGFHRWCMEHKDELLKLGPGRHFGEWWGSGVQRGYGLTKGEKRFSLFNVARWAEAERPACVGVVPILYKGLFDTGIVQATLDVLALNGSIAAPGFMNPEGVCIWHEAARIMFKKTIKDDEVPKALIGKGLNV
jgi:hypothetical protein